MRQEELLKHIQHSKQKTLTIKKIYTDLNVAQSSISRMVKKLKQFGFIKTKEIYLSNIHPKVQIIYTETMGE